MKFKNWIMPYTMQNKCESLNAQNNSHKNISNKVWRPQINNNQTNSLEQEEINAIILQIILMHNHSGYAKEIEQLKLNLKELNNEQEFLSNDINRLNYEIGKCGFINK